MQLYKFYYKNTNNLLPSYFNSFTPYYNNVIVIDYCLIRLYRILNTAGCILVEFLNLII